MINITKINQNEFRVVVESSTTTEHVVFLEDDYWVLLTDQKISKEILVERAFEFLLKREGNNSILRTFDLHEINNYFPEFEAEVKKLI